jgi:hypothetical protein
LLFEAPHCLGTEKPERGTGEQHIVKGFIISLASVGVLAEIDLLDHEQDVFRDFDRMIGNTREVARHKYHFCALADTLRILLHKTVEFRAASTAAAKCAILIVALTMGSRTKERPHLLILTARCLTRSIQRQAHPGK